MRLRVPYSLSLLRWIRVWIRRLLLRQWLYQFVQSYVYLFVCCSDPSPTFSQRSQRCETINIIDQKLLFIFGTFFRSLTLSTWTLFRPFVFNGNPSGVLSESSVSEVFSITLIQVSLNFHEFLCLWILLILSLFLTIISLCLIFLFFYFLLRPQLSMLLVLLFKWSPRVVWTRLSHFLMTGKFI